MIRKTWIGLVVFATLGVFGNETQAQFGGLFQRGPSVEVISTSELAALLDQQIKLARDTDGTTAIPKPSGFVLVDVRSESEVNVSVIPGAITKSAYEKNRDQYRGKTVIPYCTIGGRSTAYAKELAQNGVQVKNYKGSILDWVKNELPVVTQAGKPTNRVHTHSDRHRIPAQYDQVTD